jgi:hypothetical protein
MAGPGVRSVRAAGAAVEAHVRDFVVQTLVVVSDLLHVDRHARRGRQRRGGLGPGQVGRSVYRQHPPARPVVGEQSQRRDAARLVAGLVQAGASGSRVRHG